MSRPAPLWGQHQGPGRSRRVRGGGGSVIAELQETDLVTHRVLVPYGLEGEVEFIVASGFCKTSDVVARVRRDDGTIVPVMMYHHWPVRRPRPYRDRLLPDEPLVTGQRVINGLFPKIGRAHV